MIAATLVLAPAAQAAACAPSSAIDGTSTVVTFTNSSTCAWTVPSGVSSADVLVVAGGGGGAAGLLTGTAGGGAGGLVSVLATPLTAGSTQNVVVGGGGAAGSNSGEGGDGSPSTFGSLTTAVGGGGAGKSAPVALGTGTAGHAGGSGGGGGYGTNVSAGGAGTPGQGFAGGASTALGAAGSGGGAGGAAAAASGTPGIGVSKSITGTAVTYAIGGAGGSSFLYSGLALGQPNPSIGGGGRANGLSDSDAGNPGVVIVRYTTPPTTPVFSAAPAPAAGVVGAPYAGYTYAASGPPAPTFSVVTGSLPPGLTLSPAGALTGTPTTAGTSTFTVRATNIAGSATTGTQTVTITSVPAFTAASPPATATAGSAYPGYTFTASGSPSPVFSISSGALPLGVSLSSGGVLSGTPTALVTVGTYTFQVTATNTAGSSTTPTLTLAVGAAPIGPVFVLPAPTTTAAVGTPYSYSFVATGSPAPTFSVASGSLPAGLTLSSAGVLSGTPTTAGSSTFAVRASNAGGTVDTSSFTVTVNPAAAGPAFVNQTPPTTATAGTPYAGYTFTSTGYPAPTYALALGSDLLPLGLSLNATTGALTGTPLLAGSSTISVTASNATSSATSTPFTLVVAATPVAPVLVASSPPATGTAGTAYSGYTFTALGVPAPTFSINSGALPPGLTLASTGVLSGTPTTAGTYSFTVLAGNSAGTVASASRTITIAPTPVAPVFTAASPPTTGTALAPFGTYTFTASGVPAPTFSVSSGSLPLGLTLSSAGVLTGTPVATGTSTFTVTATNSAGTANTQASITIAAAPSGPVFLAAAPPDTTSVGTAYATYQFSAVSIPAATFAVTSGALPPGLTLNSAGVLSGFPTTAGAYQFAVTATNTAGSVSTGSLAITVAPAPVAPTFTASTPPSSATALTAYSGYTFAAGGTPAPTFSVTSGLLPVGLNLSSAGVLSGTPLLTGASTFTVSATNSAGTASTPVTITVGAAPVAPVFTASTPPGSATAGTAYSYQFSAFGVPNPTFSVTSGALPAGLTLDSAGLLSGTPTAAGTATFRVTAGNTAGTVTTGTLTVAVDPAPVIPTFGAASPPATGTAGTTYPAYTFTAGGVPAPTFAVSSGFLPLGLSLSSSGVLSGTPLASGASTFTVSATNTAGSVNTGAITVTIAPTPVAPVFVLASPPGGGTVGTAYAGFTFTALGVPAPTFSVASGALPPGLTLTTGGALSGTPTTAGSYAFAVVATNSAGTTTTGSLPIVVDPAPTPPVFTATTPPTVATFGTAYPGYTFTASGTPAPTFAVAGGSLPLGVLLSSAGVLSGTPLQTGTFTFTVSATNSSATVVSPSRTITVNPPDSAPLFVLQLAPGTATAGTPYAGYTYNATGYPAPTYSVASGLLPDGLTLNSATGALTGTPTTPGTSVFTIQATNSTGSVTSPSNTIAVSPTAAAPVFTDQSPPASGVEGTAYSYVFAATGYPAPTFARASGTLPTGLLLSSSGLLSGTPTTAGSYTFAVSATNASGVVSTSPKTIVIQPAAVAPTFNTLPLVPNATEEEAYSYTFSALGYPTPTYTTSDPLPFGLTLSTTGELAGTPSPGSFGAYPITVTASNNVNPDATQTITLIVLPQTGVTVPPNFIGLLPPGDGTVGSAYTAYQFAAAGYPAPSFTVTMGSLPAGLALSSGGLLTGTPTAAGDSTFTVTATNGSTDATKTVTIHVDPAPTPPVFTGAAPADATVLSAYTHQFTATGTPSTMTFTTNDPLPLGLLLLPDGTLTGLPSAGSQGDYPITVTASNGTTPDATRSVTLHVIPAQQAPFITRSTPPAATVGSAYSYAYAATGYPASITFTTSDPLPAGLSLSSAGVLSGTPTADGTFAITVTASNSVAPAATAASILTVSPASVAPSITSAAPPAGGVGQLYGFTFTASGYPAATFSTTDALPLGLVLLPTGQLSGLPLPGSEGDHQITVTASNGVNPADSTAFTLHIDPVLTAPAFTASTPTPATLGAAYAGYTFQASGNPAPTFAATGLPSGMALSSGGVLSGTPTSPGDQSFTVTATNLVSPAATVTAHLFVGTTPVFTASSPSTSATAGSAYSYTFAASGSPNPVFGTLAQLPAGWSLDANTGELSASSPVPGTFGFSVTATNASGSDTAGPFTITVGAAPSAPAFTAATPPATATVGTAYAGYHFTASGTPAPTFTSTGTLPPGLTLSAGGVLSGTPATAGTYTFAVTAANGVSPDATQAVTVTVGQAPAFTAASPPLTGTAGNAYSYTFQASGTPAPTFTTLASLPAGWTLDPATGVLSAPSPAAGSFDVAVKATNSAGAAVAGPFTVTIGQAAAAPALAPASPPATAAVGSAYGPYTFTASGYPAPTYSVDSGSLPPGLALDPATGELSGTPTTAGTSTFTVRAHNASGDDTTGPITVTVSAVATAPVFGAASPPASGQAGTAYAGYTFTAAGSPAPTFTVVNGSLPPGLSLNSAGVLSGTPTTAGTYTFSVRATNSAGAATGSPVTITIAPAPTVPSTAPTTPTIPTIPTPTTGPALPAPGGVTLTAGRASLTASWRAVTGATGYLVTASPGSATCTTTGTSCVLGGISGTPYTVTVVARSAAGESPASVRSNAATPAAPTVPATAPTTAPTTLTTDKGQVRVLVVGQPITAIGSGFAAFSSATLVIYSSPIKLADVITDSSGGFSAPVIVPKLEPGEHNLVASGTAPDGTTRLIRLPVTVTETKATDVGGQARLSVPSAGSITLLDADGNPVTRFVVPQGVYTLNPRTGVITFTEVAKFTGTADPVSYRVTDELGNEVTGTYAGIVRSLTGHATLGLPARLVSSTGPAIPCRISTGTMTRCAITATLAGQPNTVLGRGNATSAASGGARGIDVRVPLSARARDLVARPGGARITYTVTVTQAGHAVTTTTQDTATVLATRVALPSVRFGPLSAKLSKADRAGLTALRERLGSAEAVSCTGHAQTQGGDAYTRKLALRRARAACAVLTRGLFAEVTTRISIHRPPSGKKNTPEARARNRRVDIVVTN